MQSCHVQLPPDVDTQSAIAEIHKEITAMRSDISPRTGQKSNVAVTYSMVHGLDFGCPPSRGNTHGQLTDDADTGSVTGSPSYFCRQVADDVDARYFVTEMLQEVNIVQSEISHPMLRPVTCGTYPLFIKDDNINKQLDSAET